MQRSSSSSCSSFSRKATTKFYVIPFKQALRLLSPAQRRQQQQARCGRSNLPSTLVYKTFHEAIPPTLPPLSASATSAAATVPIPAPVPFLLLLLPLTPAPFGKRQAVRIQSLRICRFICLRRWRFLNPFSVAATPTSRGGDTPCQ